jgi:predicted PurR-regulated permease PerM
MEHDNSGGRFSAGERGETDHESRRPRDQWRLVLPVAASLILALGFLGIIWMFARGIAVVLLSITIADGFSPSAAWLERRMRRSFAVALVYVVAISIIALIAWFLVPMLVSEVQQFLDRAPHIFANLQNRFGKWLTAIPGQATSGLGSIVGDWMQSLASLPLTIGTSLLTLVLIVFLSFYWLLASPSISAYVRSLFPAELKGKTDHVLSELSRAMGGYLRGITLNAVATGSLAFLGLQLAGINYAFALGVITALGEFIPYLGPILAAIPAVLVAFLQSPTKALWALLIYVAVEQIEGHVLTPNIMRSQTDVPQVLVIAALFAGGTVGGVLGAIVAVPIAGAIKVLVDEIVAPAVRRKSGALHTHPETTASR